MTYMLPCFGFEDSYEVLQLKKIIQFGLFFERKAGGIFACDKRCHVFLGR